MKFEFLDPIKEKRINGANVYLFENDSCIDYCRTNEKGFAHILIRDIKSINVKNCYIKIETPKITEQFLLFDYCRAKNAVAIGMNVHLKKKIYCYLYLIKMDLSDSAYQSLIKLRENNNFTISEKSIINEMF
jgi:hypothetical protein